MRLGIFAKTFVRPTLEETLDAVVAHGISRVQFNMVSAGLSPLPRRIDPELCQKIRQELAARHIEMAAVSGTFNMIHPDPEFRRDGLVRLRLLAEACPTMGARVVTLCTGTRDLDNMWRRHPDNDSPGAWQELLVSMREAVRIAGETSVVMAFEPEIANVIDSARKARRFLDEIASPYLKVVIDPANIFHHGELSRMREVLDETFTLLGKDIVLAHAKDLDRDGSAGNLPAGKGRLDYDLYLTWLKRIGYDGPLILHGLDESQVDEAVAFLEAKLAGRK
jgi:sugar phosphate isomerase/epimerase